MESRDWLVSDSGQCQACLFLNDCEWPTNTYRLYRFLTEVENIVIEIQEDRRRLHAIRPLVRRLLTSSYWLQAEYLEPSPEIGWSVLKLYDEPDFSLSVQIVSRLPGIVFPIHNHTTWAVVALMSGQEKNTFWRRTNDTEFSNHIEPADEHIFVAGDTISFLPNTIYSVEALGDEPAISFHLYGETSDEWRCEFPPVNPIAQNF